MRNRFRQSESTSDPGPWRIYLAKCAAGYRANPWKEPAPPSPRSAMDFSQGKTLFGPCSRTNLCKDWRGSMRNVDFSDSRFHSCLVLAVACRVMMVDGRYCFLAMSLLIEGSSPYMTIIVVCLL